MHNTFTYRHSELPAVRPEIKAEIAALDVQVANLILKSQGNYRELEELAEILDDCLNSCNLNLKSIQIIADDVHPPVVELATIADLPMNQQSLVFGTAFFSAMVLATLHKLTGADIDVLTSKISEHVKSEMAEITDEQITASLKDYLARYKEDPTQETFSIKIPGIKS